MCYSISEMAKMSGISVRTLHYYDEIGLLLPSQISETGYRFYDTEALERLQQILFYKELNFSLKQIADIMKAPEYKKEEALIGQRALLCLQRKRLDGLIALLDDNLKGENTMSFKEFDRTEIKLEKEKYEKEVKEKWGDTLAYKQSVEKTKSYTKEDEEKNKKIADEIMGKFARLTAEKPDSLEVKELVREWQLYISTTYYDCTDEILAGLGQMYVMDERFRKNINKLGEGTAEFMSVAIAEYCKK